MAGRQRNLEVRAIGPDPQATFAAAVALGAEDVPVADHAALVDEHVVRVGYADLLARRGSLA